MKVFIVGFYGAVKLFFENFETFYPAVMHWRSYPIPSYRQSGPELLLSKIAK